MRIAILGVGGGLGRNVVDAARAARHEVVALVRDPTRADLPDDVATVVGDAARIEDVVRAMTGADATVLRVNPPLATWLTTFRPLLECAIAAARRTNSRLVFPAKRVDLWSRPGRRSGRRIARPVADVAARQAARRDGATDSYGRHPLRDGSPARVLRPERGDVDGARFPSCARRPAHAVAWAERRCDRARLHAGRRTRPRRRRGGGRLRRSPVPPAGRPHDAAGIAGTWVQVMHARPERHLPDSDGVRRRVTDRPALVRMPKLPHRPRRGAGAPETIRRRRFRRATASLRSPACRLHGPGPGGRSSASSGRFPSPK
jgi:hypothetical protein